MRYYHRAPSEGVTRLAPALTGFVFLVAVAPITVALLAWGPWSGREEITPGQGGQDTPPAGCREPSRKGAVCVDALAVIPLVAVIVQISAAGLDLSCSNRQSI